MSNLTGNDMPEVNKSYYIHAYPAPENVDVSVVTVLDSYQPNPGEVSFRVWESSPLQKFLCVEYDKKIGFICRASPAHNVGAYLGYDKSYTMTCKALYQRRRENHVIARVPRGGFNWLMEVGNHARFVGLDGYSLKLNQNFQLYWGFTEAKD